MPGVTMETSMVMHNIQRIIQENESLKKDVYEKSARVEEQNRKIGELISQNQRYMEQSNLLMEQRNDSLKSSSDHNQARLLQAEQDKLSLTEELATSMARMSQLQQEAASNQQLVAELQSKLTSAVQDGDTHCSRVSVLETQLEDLKETAERGQVQYRTEKQKRKEIELRVNNVEEELQDLRTDKEGLERTLLDRKRKWQAERQRWDEEMEELRRVSQQELTNLRTQLHKARTSTGQAASEQLAQLQAELEEEWIGKSKQALVLAKEQHGREIAKLAEQRDTMEQRLTELQEKFSSLKQSRDSEVHRLLQEQGQEEELNALQQKYSDLEESSLAVRQKLEGQVAELKRRLAEHDDPRPDTAGEVKRVMNGVYHSLRGEFDLNDSYTGSAVLGVIVNTIKSVTLQLLNGTGVPSSHRRENEEDQQQEEEKDDDDDDEEDSSERHAEDRPRQDVAQETEQRAEVTGQGEGEPRNVPERVSPEAIPEREKPTDAEPEDDIHTPQLRPTSPDTNPEEITPSVTETETKSESESPSEGKALSVTGEDPLCELDLTSPKSTGPPTQPPRPPSLLDDSLGQVTSLTEGGGDQDGKEPFFLSTAPTKPPPPPTKGEEDDEEDELSLKEGPPPAPLFGDDDDEEDDLDWLG
ncbi:hypothetical protein DPEC_G00261560 [Dallia pectoralis]|uniref:Uncharacterized protein n=1 Tax=Dallia pectoralis TaxID=75939 RepID=A0ACC2FRG3_DALPE|nr:hypothetical protein DPEC_G00261560 [Dallia pectoralis]